MLEEEMRSVSVTCNWTFEYHSEEKVSSLLTDTELLRKENQKKYEREKSEAVFERV